MIKLLKIIGLGILFAVGFFLLAASVVGYVFGVAWLFSLLPLPNSIGWTIGGLTALILPFGVCLATIVLDD